MTSDPKYSQFFTKFMHGCEKQMGRFAKQDQVLSLVILLDILKDYHTCKELSQNKITGPRQHAIIMSGTSMVVRYDCGRALHGGEMLLAEAATNMCNFVIEQGKEDKKPPHAVACLMGQFKSEAGETNVMLPFASSMTSGIEI